MTTSVYRAYDVNDDVIYVGMSLYPESRISEHKRKWWGEDIARFEIVARFSRRKDAELLEARLIREQQPSHNKYHTEHYRSTTWATRRNNDARRHENGIGCRSSMHCHACKAQAAS